MKITKAYSYIRWSTVGQGQGDSKRRQIDQAIAYAAKHGLELVPENMMQDAGLSAYTGKNVKDGALGTFIEAVEAGKIEKGSYLLVESLDRISRENPMDAMHTLHRIVKNGIVVVALADNEMEFRHPVEPMKILMSVMIMIRANEESEKKGKRVKESWGDRWTKGRTGQKDVSKVCPSWLKPNAKGDDFDIIEKNATIVRRIFQLSAGGYGFSKIAQTLNKDGVKTLKGRKGVHGPWRICSIANILQSRTVLGEYQPNTRDEVDRHKKIPVGEPIKGRYPAIISKELFDATQTALRRRRTKGSGRHDQKYSNLFKGLVKCAHCGGSLHVSKHNHYVSSKIIFCSGSRTGTCKAKSWQYDKFEAAMLSFVNEIDLEAVMNGGTRSRIHEVTSRIDQLEAEKHDVQTDLNKLLDLFLSSGLSSDMAKGKIQEFNERVGTLDSQIAELNKERAELQDINRATGDTKQFRFPDNASAQELYNLRVRAAEHIRSLIEDIKFVKHSDGEQGIRILVNFKGGACRGIITNNQGDSFMVVDQSEQGWFEKRAA